MEQASSHVNLKLPLCMCDLFVARPLSIKIRRTLLVTCNVALSNFGFWYKTKTQTSLTTLVKYDQKWALVTHLNKVAI